MDAIKNLCVIGLLANSTMAYSQAIEMASYVNIARQRLPAAITGKVLTTEIVESQNKVVGVRFFERPYVGASNVCRRQGYFVGLSKEAPSSSLARPYFAFSQLSVASECSGGSSKEFVTVDADADIGNISSILKTFIHILEQPSDGVRLVDTLNCTVSRSENVCPTKIAQATLRFKDLSLFKMERDINGRENVLFSGPSGTVWRMFLHPGIPIDKMSGHRPIDIKVTYANPF